MVLIVVGGVVVGVVVAVVGVVVVVVSGEGGILIWCGHCSVDEWRDGQWWR